MRCNRRLGGLRRNGVPRSRRASTESLAASSRLPRAAPPSPGYGMTVPLPGMHVDVVSGLLLPTGTKLASVGAYFPAMPLAIVTLGTGCAIWVIIAWTKGTSPALQVLGMRCWRPETGRVASFCVLALREILGRIADNTLGITALVPFILFHAGKERKALHDHLARTIVLCGLDKVLPS